MTMAFAVLCSARLFHGFSCKKKGPVIFSKDFFNNKFGLMAFGLGMVFLNSVLLVPQLKGTFQDSRHDRYAVCMDIHSKLWLYARYPAYKGDILYKV